MVQYMRPVGDKADDGNWESTDESEGSAVFYTAIDEASIDDNDYITGDASGGATTIDFELTNGITDPGVTTGHKIVYRWSLPDEGGSSNCNLTAKLMVGSTVHATQTLDTTGGGASYTTTTYAPTNLDSALGSATAYNNAFLRFTFDDDDALETVRISWAYVEVPDAAAAAPAAEPDLPGAAFLMFVDQLGV